MPIGTEIRVAMIVITTVPIRAWPKPPASPPAGLPSSTHAESSMPVMPFMSYAMICGLAIRVGRPAERTDHSTETSGTRATRNASHTRLRHRPSAARRRFSITRVAT